ncbi:MAG: hypothetical protein K6U11_13000 [bacterium]|nr:hypothetical protein [bacterium]
MCETASGSMPHMAPWESRELWAGHSTAGNYGWPQHSRELWLATAQQGTMGWPTAGAMDNWQGHCPWEEGWLQQGAMAGPRQELWRLADGGLE